MIRSKTSIYMRGYKESFRSTLFKELVSGESIDYTPYDSLLADLFKLNLCINPSGVYYNEVCLIKVMDPELLRGLKLWLL